MSLFSDHVTSTAFSLSLSKKQIDALCRIQYDNSVPDLKRILHLTVDFRTLDALNRRGLIYWVDDDRCGGRHGPYITRPAEHIIELIKLAGLYPATIPKSEAA